MLKQTDGKEQTRNLQMIVNNGRHLSNLVNDILDYSRLKNRDIFLQFAGIDLKKALDKKFFLSTSKAIWQ